MHDFKSCKVWKKKFCSLTTNKIIEYYSGMKNVVLNSLKPGLHWKDNHKQLFYTNLAGKQLRISKSCIWYISPNSKVSHLASFLHNPTKDLTSEFPEIVFYSNTLPGKNMNLPYSKRMYWKNFWQPTDQVQQNIFEKTFTEIGSSHLYASFGTFCVQIGNFLEAQWVFSKGYDDNFEFFRKFKISLCLE